MPMSSPKMMRMFGFFAPPAFAVLAPACATAIEAFTNSNAVRAATRTPRTADASFRDSSYAHDLVTIPPSPRRQEPRFTLLIRRQLPHHLVEVEARRLLADRVVLEALQPLPYQRLRRHQQEGVVEHPPVVLDRLG